FPRSSVGMPSSTLRVARLASLSAEDAERPGRHSHAERGNEGTCSTGQGYVEEWRSARSLTFFVSFRPQNWYAPCHTNVEHRGNRAIDRRARGARTWGDESIRG